MRRFVLPLFDADYYRVRRQVSSELSDEALLVRYLLTDFPVGHPPGPLFDADFYVSQVERTGLGPVRGMAPFHHWLSFGVDARISPTPLFADEEYLAFNPDLQDYPDWLFFHFVRHGIGEGRRFLRVATSPRSAAAGALGAPPVGIELIRAYAPAGPKAQLEEMRSFFGSPQMRDLVSHAASIEPRIPLVTSGTPSIVAPWHDDAYRLHALMQEVLPDRQYDYILLVPFGKMGGADHVAGLLSAELARHGNTLILRTDSGDWTHPDWYSDQAACVDVSRYLSNLPQEIRARALFLLVQGLRPRAVFNVNSRRAFEMFRDMGRQLKVTTRLYAYYFTVDYTPDGRQAGLSG